MPYGITQCYLTAGSGDLTAFTPAEAGTLVSDCGETQGWVDDGVLPHHTSESQIALQLLWTR